MHHLIANHQQILSETVYRSFEVPLLHELDAWRRSVDDEDETYARAVAARSREIRKLEKEGLKLHRANRRRDVAQFREHLVNLTGKLDGLTALHADHARSVLRDSQEASVKILDASCSLVRAEVDIFESLARKGWTGGGLDELLEKGQDLFASEDDVPAATAAAIGSGTATAAVGGGGADGGAKLFSILPPKSILANDTASDTTPRGGGHGRADSLLVDAEEDQYQSLTGAINQRDRGRGGGDTESIFSESNLSRGPGIRPFSPQPIRRRPTDVVMDPEALLLGRSQSQNQQQVNHHSNNDSSAHELDNESTTEDDEEYDCATIKHGPRDTSSQGLAALGLGDVSSLSIRAHDEDESPPESPWKDEGLRRKHGTSSSSSTKNGEHVEVEVEVEVEVSRPSSAQSKGSGGEG